MKIGAEHNDGPGSRAVQSGRIEFMRRIEFTAPEVLRELRDVLSADDRDCTLAAWAAQRGLADPWALAAARWALRTWSDGFAADEPLHWPVLNGGSGWVVTVAEPCRPYQSNFESLPQFTARVAKWMKENIEAADALAISAGWQPTPDKHAPRGTRDPGLHYEWLVRYQCQHWTHREIAEKYGRSYRKYRNNKPRHSAPAVERALAKTASFIGLTLR